MPESTGVCDRFGRLRLGLQVGLVLAIVAVGFSGPAAADADPVYCTLTTDDPVCGGVPVPEPCHDSCVPDVEPACNDEIDNDGDRLTDHPDDPECRSWWDPSENQLVCESGCLPDLTAGLLMIQRPTLTDVDCSGTYTTEGRVAVSTQGEGRKGLDTLEVDVSSKVRWDTTVHWAYDCSSGHLDLPAKAKADDITDRERELLIQVENEDGTWDPVDHCSYRTIEEPFKDACSESWGAGNDHMSESETSPADGTKWLPSKAEVCVESPDQGVRAVEQSRLDVPQVVDGQPSVFKTQVGGWARHEEACEVVEIEWEEIEADLCGVAASGLCRDVMSLPSQLG